MSDRVLDGFACTRCGAEPACMVPDGFGERGQLFRCEGACVTIACIECGAHFDGSRTEARRAQWEPFSTSSQLALDHGPMVCSDCVGALLDNVLAAMLKAAKAGRF